MKEKKVKNYYNEFSQNYDDFYKKLQFEKYNIVLADETIFPEWVLDHGGGTGLLSQWMNYPILTIDISDAMIRKGLSGKTKAQAVVGDMNHIPLRSNSIGTILSFTVLQNSTNIIQSLNEILRIIEANGKLFLTILEKKFPKDIFYHWMTKNNIDFQITRNVVEDIAFVTQVS